MPAKAKITTQADVDAIPFGASGTQPITWAEDLTHFGVRAGAREKVYVVGKRVEGKWKIITIGKASEISVHKARNDAKQLIGEMVGGTDPVARKRDATAGGMTFAEAWELQQATMKKKGRSPATFTDYQNKIDAHLTDWLDRPLVAITPEACNKRHEKIGENNGKFMANGCMRIVRLIWRRARRQNPGLPETPTANIDFYEEKGRTAVITNWPAWWNGVQQIVNPVRRDFYIWLAFSGCRAGETMSMEVANVDLDNGVVKYPITKTDAFELPISKFMVELLRKRIADNAEQFGSDCRWVFPSVTAASGHLEEEKLIASEPKLFKQHWSPHTLRHSWITLSEEKVKISDAHQRLLTNHKLKKNKDDSHSGYIHPDLDDLRKSQNKMTKFLLALIEPTPGKGTAKNKPSKNNVVDFKRAVA